MIFRPRSAMNLAARSHFDDAGSITSGHETVATLDGDNGLGAPLILVVDDDAPTRDVLTELLRLEGYCARSFASGYAVMAELCRGLRPRLILLDLRMPDLNGWDFRRLQLADPELAKIPVVIATGATEHPLDHIITTAAGLLRKPVSADMLLSTVARLVLGH